MNPEAFVASLREHLVAHADPERAAPMAAYMKGRFPFLGIGAVERRRLLGEFLDRNGGRPDADAARILARLFWREPEREFHYVGQELLGFRVGALGPADLPLIEHLVTTNAWWDTVDFLAATIAGSILRRHREALAPACEEWLDSGDLWLQWTAILCQLKWKDETDLVILERVIDRTRHSPEFFLQKAIGWALREFARTDPAWVREFLERTELSPLSRREASKHL